MTAMRTDDPAIWAIGECAEHAGQCVGLVAPSFAQAEVAAAVHPRVATRATSPCPTRRR